MNSVYVCFLLGIILQTVTSQITPEITFISPNQIGEVGDSVDLQCSAKNAQDTPILWTKTGEYTIYISRGEALLVPDNRYSISHNQTSSTFTLKIRNLISDDAGLYRCVLAIAPNNQPSADVQLAIR